MTNGASGGGWTIEGQYVNSVISYSYTGDEPNHVYGPYFGGAAEKVWKQAKKA